MSEVLDLFLKTVDRYCVFDMVGIVFASFFYCYYMPRSSMFITYIQHEWRVVLDSARMFPTSFAKMRPIDPKKDRVLSGPKQSLVKWPLIFPLVWYVQVIYLSTTPRHCAYNQLTHYMCCNKTFGFNIVYTWERNY